MSTVVATLLAPHVFAVAIRSSVITSSGPNGTLGNATHRVVGTAGQPAVGMGGAGGAAVCSGFWCFGGGRLGAVVPPASDLPKVFAFALVSSNPTRGPAQFELALPRASGLTLRVYDVSGRLVGDPLERRFEAGRHRLTWGTDHQRSGVYFIRITSDVGFTAKRKITLVR